MRFTKYLYLVRAISISVTTGSQIGLERYLIGEAYDPHRQARRLRFHALNN